MLDNFIILIGFVIALFIVGPLGWVIDRRTERTYKEAWEKVQEQTRTKGVAVGELAKLLGRNTISE